MEYMKTVVSVTALFLIACDSALPDFDCVYGFEAGGMTFCLEYEPEQAPDPAVVERLVSIVEKESSRYYPAARGLREALEKRNVLVVVTNGHERVFVGGCQEVGHSGLRVCSEQFNGFMELESGFIMLHPMWRRNWDFNHTVLAHELLHAVDTYLLGANMGHARPMLFRQQGVETIEHAVVQALVDDSWERLDD
jgi:hypothetical protein